MKKEVTKNMKLAIIKIYNLDTSKINKSTIKALFDRELIDENNILTENGRNYIISTFPLKKQCEKLELKLIEVELNYDEKIEEVALKYFEEKGYLGTSIEGMALFTILKGYILDKLEKYNRFNSRIEAYRDCLESQLLDLENYKIEITQCIETIDLERFKNNMNEILNDRIVMLFCQGLTSLFAEKIFLALDKEIVKNLFLTIWSNPFLYRNGWTDLILVKDNKIKFVEVKGKDKLHESQIITIQKMKKILPFEFSVIKIIKKKN